MIGQHHMAGPVHHPPRRERGLLRNGVEHFKGPHLLVVSGFHLRGGEDGQEAMLIPQPGLGAGSVVAADCRCQHRRRKQQQTQGRQVDFPAKFHTYGFAAEVSGKNTVPADKLE